VNLADIILLTRKLTNDRLASGQMMSQEDFLRTLLNETVVPDFVGRKKWFFKNQVATSQAPLGTHILQFPQSLQDVKLLILHTGTQGTTKKLTRMPMVEFFDVHPDPSQEARGYPESYTWVNRQVWFDKPMGGDYNIRMIGLLRPNKLINEADTPFWLDEDKHMLLVYGLAGFVYQSVEDSKNSQVWFNIYEQGVDTYWKESENQLDIKASLGKFMSKGEVEITDPINSPFVQRYNS